MRKRFCLLFLTLFLCLCFAGAAAAGEEQALEKQEDAIERAKEIFPGILQGKEKEFEVDYREDSFNQGDLYWYLNWHSRTPGVDRERISIRLDASTGELLHFDSELPPGDIEAGDKIISREQAKEIARQFVSEQYPGKLPGLKLDADYSYSYRQGDYLELEYSFRWYREINGIPYGQNSVRVNVNALTGQVSGVYYSWEKEEDLPESSAISTEELTGQAVEELGMYPCYIINRAGSSGLPGAKLVYRLNTQASQFSAATGKPYGNRGEEIAWKEAREFEQDFKVVPAEEIKTGYNQPESKINPVQAREKAEKVFDKLGLEGEVRRSGSGSSSGAGYSQEYWIYSLQNESGNLDLRVNINARTGALTGYTNRVSGVKEGGSGDRVTRQQALQAAKDFLQVAGKDLLEDRVLVEKTGYYYPEKNVFRFSWVRLVNGVPFMDDAVNVNINKHTGKVESFRHHDRPVKSFASTKGLIAEEEAVEVFQAAEPFELLYSQLRDYEKRTSQTVLAYNLTAAGVGARSGELLDRGAGEAEKETYGDKLQSHWARTPLTLLANSGLLPEPGQFNPGDTVSRREGLRVLGAACDRYYYRSAPYTSPFRDVGNDAGDLNAIVRAVDLGIVEKGGKLHPDAPLTREQLAVWLVNALGHGEIASTGISMEVPFKDASRISSGRENYVSIVKGLGLMGGDKNGNFRPQDNVTWGELASVAVNAAPRLRD